MKDLRVAATGNTPGIEADWALGRLRLLGDSYPENSFDFFQPLVVWLEAYLSTARPLIVEVGLAYLNTSSVRVMMDLLDMLEESFRQGREIRLTWFFEPGNERVAGLAEEFQEDCSFPYQVVPGRIS